MLRLLAQSEQGYSDIASLTGAGVEDVRAKVKQALAALDGEPDGEQRAMLRLLAQREQGYEDIAALTGQGVDDVRAKVRTALAELEGSEAAAPRAKAPEEPSPKASEEPKAAASEPKAAASEPKQAPQPRPAPPKASSAPARPRPGSGTGLKLPQDKGALRAIAAGGAVLFVVLLLLVTGVLGGDDDGSDSNGSGDVAAGSGSSGGGAREPTEAVLEPVAGLDASGRALFGRSGQTVLLLLRADGLPPSPKGRSYTVSLVRADDRLPLIATKVGANGVINGRFPVATQVLGLLAAGFTAMDVSLVDDRRLRAALAQAQKSQTAPAYGGVTVLRGEVTGPIVEAGEDG